MELNIYHQSGVLKLTVSTASSSTLNRELMTENAVSASFTHFTFAPLEVNDYVLLEGVKYSIKKEYKPKQKNRQTYDYSVKFYGPEHDAEQVMYLNLTDGQYEPQFSLDGSPREHLQKWVDNMNRIYGSAVWSIGDVIDAPNQTLEYSNTTCWDALASIAEAFATEWWADGFYINLSRCERGERVSLGPLQGLTSLTQSENTDDVKFFTRLIPLGSTKNIDRSRYGFSRLQLPDKSKYVDRNTHYGLYEHVETEAFAGIFPHYTGTVTSVRIEEKIGENKKPFTVYYFKDSGMAFDPSAKENQIGSLVKHVSFQTGDLAGRDFEANYNSGTKEWEIVNTYPTEEIQIPGGNLIPRPTDTYIPWNFRMPVEYERQAELDFKAAVDTFLAKYSEDIAKYGGDTDYTHIDRHSIPLALGQSVRLLSDEYFPGIGYRDSRLTKVVRKLDNLSIATIECANQVGKGWKKRVDDSLSNLQYVVGETLNQAVIDVLKSWDSREASEYNVFSALNSLKKFLRKDQPDTASELITFLKGIISESVSKFNAGAEFGNYTGINGEGAFIDELGNAIFNDITTRGDLTIGGKLVATIIEALDRVLTKDLSFTGTMQSKDFVSGLLGLGVSIGADGKIEADSMELRKELIVPTLIFNRVRVVGNELWITEGGDIESIEADASSGDNLYWLKLKGTDANSPCPLWEDDIIRGIVKTKGDSGEFGGFYTVEMRVVSIAADQTFSAIPRFADKPPVAGLTIARTGNFTNRSRMRSIYLSSDGGYIRFLDEVDGWDILPRMIKCQLGNMDGLSVDGVESMAGYNAYLDNVLAKGAFVQISQDGVTERPVPCFKGDWHTGKYYYYDEVTRNGNRYLCIGKTTEQQPAYDATDWLMTDGNAKFSVSVDSSKGYEFFSGQLDTALSATVFSGNEDITGGIPLSGIRWYRKSGDDVSDTIWNTDHATAGVSIALTNNDIPPSQPDLVEFTCEVTITYNDKVYKPSDSILI